VENEDGDITGCVSFSNVLGVFPAKRQGCTVCDFNLVLPFAKKEKKRAVDLE
jgi:hypothetical protein